MVYQTSPHGAPGPPRSRRRSGHALKESGLSRLELFEGLLQLLFTQQLTGQSLYPGKDLKLAIGFLVADGNHPKELGLWEFFSMLQRKSAALTTPKARWVF